MQRDYLTVPAVLEDNLRAYYSTSSRLILLEGPRGYMLANYPYAEPPDATRFRFLTSFDTHYIPFTGTMVPDRVKDTVVAVACPVPKSADSRGDIYSGATSLSSGAGPSLADVRIMPVLAGDINASSLKQPGMRVGPTAMESHFGSGGLSINDEGVHVTGSLLLKSTIGRGITRESPLFSLIPKSVVTFFAADYQPDMEKIQEYANFVLQITMLVEAMGRLGQLILNITRRIVGRN